MNLNDLIFIDSLPKLDIHGYDRQSARVAIEDYIRDSKKMKHAFFVIVHGNGSGILRSETDSTLKKNPLVVEYQRYYYNRGCTVVHIRV